MLLLFIKSTGHHEAATRGNLKCRARIRGSKSSAFLALLGISLTLPHSTLALADSASAQIHRAIEQHLNVALEQEASRQGWQGARLSHDSQIPAQARELPPCPVTLQLRTSTSSLLERQQFRLRCTGEKNWELAVMTQVRVSVPAVHAANVIERGQAFSAADLRLHMLDLGKARRGFYSQTDEVIGLVAKRRIRPKQLVTPSLLDQPLAVQRGQPVKIIANQDSIEASTMGEALGDGRAGDLIRVRNSSSGKIIDAKIMEPGVVSSIF